MAITKKTKVISVKKTINSRAINNVKNYLVKNISNKEIKKLIRK